MEQQIDGFYLKEGQYLELLADEDGITRSTIFPRLWLDRPALVNGNMKQVITILKLGIESKEHNNFVMKLSSI